MEVLEVVAGALGQLRRLLAVIESGDVDATEPERAHLAGAVEALERITSSRP